MEFVADTIWIYLETRHGTVYYVLTDTLFAALYLRLGLDPPKTITILQGIKNQLTTIV